MKPSSTTLRLFKVLVATQRPEAMNTKTLELKESPAAFVSGPSASWWRRCGGSRTADLPRAYAALHGLIAGFAAPLRACAEDTAKEPSGPLNANL